MTHYDILTPSQRALLPHLAALRKIGYTLYGGTAIALQLGHRQSVDFDFFSDRPLDEDAIRASSPVLAKAPVTQAAPRTLTVLARASEDAEGVKVSFFGGLRVGRVGEPVSTSGGELRLASLDDLLGHKLKVLLHRVEMKDYRDIAAMLRAGLTLVRGLGVARAIFDTSYRRRRCGRSLSSRAAIWRASITRTAIFSFARPGTWTTSNRCRSSPTRLAD